MDARFDYADSDILQKFIPRLVAASQAIPGSTLPAGLQELVKIRASQINGCTVCTDMHIKEAEAAGETSLRLHLVAVWRDATVFTDAERAALEVTEQATRIADGAGGVTDAAWASAAAHFDSEQLVTLACQIALINSFNRLNVISRTPGGSYTPGEWS